MPGLPIFGTVSAATPFVPDTPKPSSISEPNRVAQIMKYGFPGKLLSFNFPKKIELQSMIIAN